MKNRACHEAKKCSPYEAMGISSVSVQNSVAEKISTEEHLKGVLVKENSEEKEYKNIEEEKAEEDLGEVLLQVQI